MPRRLGLGARDATADKDLEGKKSLRYLAVSMDSTTMKQMLDLLESEGPKSMSYEDICSWAEGQDWLSKDWATHVPPLDATGEYTRNILCLKPFEVVLLHWPPGTQSAVHHHQGSVSYTHLTLPTKA